MRVIKETGILFTPDNIRAIREGRKFQTRRVIEKQPNTVDKEPKYEKNTWGFWGGEWPDYGRLVRESPYGKIGDRLYVKEGVITHASIPQLVGYYADGCRVTEHWEKRLTAMFMPKWAARTWLEITDVRVERLQDISAADCFAEGIAQTNHEIPMDPQILYKDLWDSINKAKHPWSQNPFCWCLSFRKLEAK